MMNIRTPHVVGMLMALGLAVTAHPAAAQIFKICGDVDDSKDVTVTDGVQVLRAAAGLESDCTPEICDADVSGTIGVSDGVIVLRKAAGLDITENCIPDDGRIGLELNYLIKSTQPIVSEVLGTLVAHKSELLDHSLVCDHNAGTIDFTASDGQLDASFDECVLKSSLVSGDAENANRAPLLTVDVGSPGSDDVISFESHTDFGLLGVNTTRGFKLSGVLDATPDFGGFDVGLYLVELSSVEISPTGVVLAGSMKLDFDAESNVTGIHEAQVVYDGSNLAHVIVTLSDGSVRNYKFELKFRNFI